MILGNNYQWSVASGQCSAKKLITGHRPLTTQLTVAIGVMERLGSAFCSLPAIVASLGR
jgi:hypothetical protein